MEGRRKEGRTDGLLARDVRGAAAETAGEDRAKASGRGGRRRTEPPPPTPETRAGYHTVVRPPRRGDGPRRTSSRRTTGPNEPPDAPRPGRIERQRDDGRPLKASFLRKDRHGRYLPARTGPQRTRRAGHEARGAVATSNCSPACRAAPGPRRTPGRARARPSPQTGGSGSAAGSADRGEPTAGGEGERHSRTRASGGRGDGNGPRKAPHPGPRETTDPSDDRATRANRRESHRPKTPPEAVPPPNQRSQAGPKPTAPPREPGKTQHERLPTQPPPPKTPEREVGPRHTSSDTPGTTDRRSPKAASEREVSQSRHTRNTLAPWRGRSPMIPKRGNAAAWRRTRRPSIDGTSTSDTHAWTRSGMSAPRERR